MYKLVSETKLLTITSNPLNKLSQPVYIIQETIVPNEET